jgi:hypothetical protein
MGEGWVCESPDDLQAAVSALQQTKPHYHFSTRAFTPKPTPTKPNPTPMTITQFDGACDFSVNGQAPSATSPESAVEDQTGEAGEPVEQTEPTDAGEQVEEQVDLTDKTLDELLELAANEDVAVAKPVHDRLLDLAEEAGVAREDAVNAASWQDVVNMITGDSTMTEPEPEPWKPTKGLAVKWVEVDPSTGKPKLDKSKKPVKPTEFEVLSVQEKTETATLKSSTTGKPVAGKDKLPLKVKWTDLIHD